MASENIPTKGGRALGRYIKRQGLSIQKWCEEHGLDRVQIQRIISGARGKRVSVDMATDIARATKGAIAVELFRSDTLDSKAA